MLIALRLALTPVAIVAIAASATFAFRFGWSKGSTEIMAWAFAALLCGLDVGKAVLPFLATWARDQGDKLRVWIVWASFAILTLASLWAALGVTAIQLSETMTERAAAATEIQRAAEAVKQRRHELEAVPSHSLTTAEAVAAARDAVRAADKAVEQECGKVGDNCRKRTAEATGRRAELAAALRDRALTEQAADATARLRTAEDHAARLDVRKATAEADPQAAALSRALGISEHTVSMLSFVLASIMVEIGSGLLPWMLYGHSASRPKPDVQAPQAIEETLEAETPPAAAREDFFRECVLPALGKRVSAGSMFTAYQRWALERGHEPMTATLFGRASPLPKSRIGGMIYYTDVELARGYGATRRELRVVQAEQPVNQNFIDE